MYNFCTYFDSNYLIQGVTLYRSLVKHCKDFKLYVLCLDEKTYELLNRLNEERIQAISLQKVEEYEPELLHAKENRNLVEYYFTLSPVLPLYILKKHHVDIVTYLDADLFFYSKPDDIYRELGGNSILITPHRFPPELKENEKYGKYNIQYLSFRNDETGLKCLERWKDQCIEWCYDRLENGKFADQKYLDEWPGLYHSLVVSQNIGVGAAPWNVAHYQASIEKGNLSLNNEKVVFYHFHGFKVLGRKLISHGMGHYHKPDRKVMLWLYSGYMHELEFSRGLLQEKTGTINNINNNSDQRYRRGRWLQLLIGIYRKQLMYLN